MTEERKEELLYLWEHETNEDWTQEWRDELNADEQALVEEWDYGFINGLARMYKDIHAPQKMPQSQTAPSEKEG